MNAIALSPEMALEKQAVVEQAVARERNRLFNFIKTKVADTGDAEDILQDVFFQLWQGYHTIESIEKLTSWMFRVARNKIIDRYRKQKPEAFSKMQIVGDEGEAPLLLSEIISDSGSAPDDVYTRELIWDSIETVLGELPVKQRDVFVWHELEGLSFKQMSENTGDSLNTLLSRKRYAVNYLRKRLQDVYNELDD
jgi:RNA polymerase sigma factor (sigma-70 family)